MSSSLFESLRFRVHVRNLLYDYVKKHCTVDYVTFTEGVVSEFFEDLQLVPLTDPYSLTLPVDPFDTLEKIYSELPYYSPEDHDVMRTSQETVAFLKEVFKTRAGKCRTAKVFMSDSYGIAPPQVQEPLYPALTRRAHRNTKKLGIREDQRHTLKELFEEHKLAVLEVEKVEEPNGDLEDTLKMKISMYPGEQPAVKSLLHSTLDTLRTDKPYMNRQLDPNFLCSQYPTELTYTAPEDVFMPIFPRRRRIGKSTPATGVALENFKSLMENAPAPFELVGVANFDEDIPRQNLVLVGGWQAIKSSPPSTPSSNFGRDDELDELDDLRFPSSPSTTPPPVYEIENSKMEQILIPRSRRIGGTGGVAPHMLRGKTLKTFLAPLLFRPRTGREEEPGAERIPSPTPSSLIGQPPSTLDVDHGIDAEGNDYLDYDVGLDIQKVCEGCDLEPDFYLDETIDDKATLLMEVPTLPQPIEFQKDFYVPKSLSDLIIPSTAKDVQRQRNVDLPFYRFLKKVKGCQSLTLQLSWVPFTIDKHPPTVLEIINVVDLFPLEVNEKVMGLIGSVAAEPSSLGTVAGVSIRRGLETGSEDLIYEVQTEEFQIMLNRKERSRVGNPHGFVCDDSGNTDRNIPDDADTFKPLTPDTNNLDTSDPFDVDMPLKKPRPFVQDQLSLENDSAIEFSDCRPQECGSVSGDNELVLSENGNTIRAPIPDNLDLRMEVILDTDNEVATSRRQPTGLPADFDPSNTPELSRHSLRSFAFAELRARKVSVPLIEPAPVEELVTSPGTVGRVDLPRGPPPEICDANTIYLADATIPQSIHKYLACLGLIQRQALVRALCSRNCAIELVERRDLAGVDLILDTDTAVVFINLFSLSSRCDEWVDKITRGSWKFDRLLIIFEAYDELSAKKTKHRHPSMTTSRVTVGYSSQLYAYTPPVVKALKKLKRNLCIAEACGTKRAATVLQYGFADTVEEAALFSRLYGDWCEANDRTHGAIWGKRDWLDADFLEDNEDNLASLHGFNHFSASIVLCQVSLKEFLNFLPEERVSVFGAYILADHIRECNEDLDARWVAMQTGQGSEIEVGLSQQHSHTFT